MIFYRIYQISTSGSCPTLDKIGIILFILVTVLLLFVIWSKNVIVTLDVSTFMWQLDIDSWSFPKSSGVMTMSHVQHVFGLKPGLKHIANRNRPT